MTANNLLLDLIHKTNAVRGRAAMHDEWHCTCPACGAESRPTHTKCSFSERGFFCFACGAGMSLPKFAETIGVARPRPVSPPKPKPKPASVPAWMFHPEPLLARYESHPQRLALWQAHKPVTAEMVIVRHLGVGVLPASACRHERLILPIFDGRKLVGLRGRRIDCSCAKWLAPGGTQMNLYPLYNQEVIQPGCTVIVGENPVDALLVSERFAGVIGVATYSIAYWNDAWTEALRPACRVEIVYDNDVPGRVAGVRLANRLQKAGLRNTYCFQWPVGTPEKMDIGSMLIVEA